MSTEVHSPDAAEAAAAAYANAVARAAGYKDDDDDESQEEMSTEVHSPEAAAIFAAARARARARARATAKAGGYEVDDDDESQEEIRGPPLDFEGLTIRESQMVKVADWSIRHFRGPVSLNQISADQNQIPGTSAQQDGEKKKSTSSSGPRPSGSVDEDVFEYGISCKSGDHYKSTISTLSPDKLAPGEPEYSVISEGSDCSYEESVYLAYDDDKENSKVEEESEDEGENAVATKELKRLFDETCAELQNSSSPDMTSAPFMYPQLTREESIYLRNRAKARGFDVQRRFFSSSGIEEGEKLWYFLVIFKRQPTTGTDDEAQGQGPSKSNRQKNEKGSEQSTSSVSVPLPLFSSYMSGSDFDGPCCSEKSKMTSVVDFRDRD